jgi:hypothetical protein
MEISKRDYFAASALSALIARIPPEGDEAVYERVANEAYAYADAMMRLTRTLHDPIEITPDELAQREASKDSIIPVRLP